METSKRPYRSIPPGEVLKDELDARRWTQGDFAKITDRPLQAINEILAGKKAITPETALLFSKALGTSPEFWLNLESAFRLDKLYLDQQKPDHDVARRARIYSIAPVKELTKRHWINPAKNIDQLEAEVCDYLGISDLDEQPRIAANFKKSDAGVSDTPALMAWVRKAELEARKLTCPAFDPQKFAKTVSELPQLSTDEKATSTIPKKLCATGVRLVFVRHLPQTRVDGAAFWIDKQPVVALSLRMDRIDNFWFTLMHELVHIMEGARSSVSYLDQDIMNEPENDMERKINQRARDILIPRDSFNNYVRKTKPYFSRSVVIAFAHELGIHPAIVVGRLQHEKLIPYTNLRNLISKASVVF